MSPPPLVAANRTVSMKNDHDQNVGRPNRANTSSPETVSKATAATTHSTAASGSRRTLRGPASRRRPSSFLGIQTRANRNELAMHNSAAATTPSRNQTWKAEILRPFHRPVSMVSPESLTRKTLVAAGCSSLRNWEPLTGSNGSPLPNNEPTYNLP